MLLNQHAIPSILLAAFKGAWPGLVIGFIGLYLLAVLKKKLREQKNKIELSASTPLSKREQDFFMLARECVPDCIILAQVDIKQILKLKNGNRWRYMNELGRLSIDFVILSKDFELIACIELDDSSHDRPKAKINDEKKERYLRQTGTALIRFRKMPVREELKNKMELLIKKRFSNQKYPTSHAGGLPT
jgi:very-short-patch-repair endonuclease